MTESKNVKINLKKLIEDFFFANTRKDYELVEEIKQKFETVYSAQSDTIKEAMVKYLINDMVVKDNVKMIEYFTSFQK